MVNARTPINSSEEVSLDHLKQYLDTAAGGKTLT